MSAPLVLDRIRQLRANLLGLHRESALRDERIRQSDLGEKGRLGGLIHFVRYFWPLLEPNTTLVEGEPMRAIILHLEAITRGEIQNIIINVSPGSMKSLLVNVFWPAWEWGPAGMPWLRYVTFAYGAYLTERDNQRFLDVVKSDDYQELWRHVFVLTRDGQIKPQNDHKGWKFSSSMKGIGTGERGHRILADDLHNVKEGESEAVRTETVRWAREGMSNRLNDMQTGVIVLIGQRVHEMDVTNAMLEVGGYVHLAIRNEYDPQFHCATEWWEDGRTELGELAWPERFPREVTERIKGMLGPTAYAAQYQQDPEPRGGGILKRDWWKYYRLPIGSSPPISFECIIASLDPAFTSRQENDPSGFVVFGLYLDKAGDPHLLMLQSWKKWLELHGVDIPKGDTEPVADYVRRAQPNWGLVEYVAYECTRLNVSVLLIEDKASGHSVAQEIQRLFATRTWSSILLPTGNIQDKRSRAYSVQHILAGGMCEIPVAEVCGYCGSQAILDASKNLICAKCPEGRNSHILLMPRPWAQQAVDECAKFRGLPGDEDNIVDAITQGLRWMREWNYLIRPAERQFMEREAATFKRPLKPLYDV